MIVLVYEIDKYYKEEFLKKGIDIDDLKKKLKFILSKYLEDRKYIDKKVDNWRDAILNECELLFLNFKEYKTFINLLIYNNGLKESHGCQTWNTISGKNTVTFDVEFKSQNINSYLNVSMFTKNKKRTKKDLGKAVDLIEKEFLNLAEGREYNIFYKKYYELFKIKFDEILKNYKYSLFFFIQLSNKFFKYSIGYIIINKDKESDDYFLSKFINADECKLDIVFGKAQ